MELSIFNFVLMPMDIQFIGFNFYGVLLISFAHSDACLLGLVSATKSVSQFTTLSIFLELLIIMNSSSWQWNALPIHYVVE
jgi:hypothetical protein